MKVKKALSVLLTVLILTALFSWATLVGAADDPVAGATDMTENFDDVSTLTSSGWILDNNSFPPGFKCWFQGDPYFFGSVNGGADSYIAANFESTYYYGTISNWLITPELYLENGATFTFYTRAVESVYPDRLEVRLSTTGACTGATACDVGDFSTLLLSINPDLEEGGYPNEWAQYTVTISGLSEPITGRIAFRYFVTDAGMFGSNSKYIGIDSVSYQAPADLALAASVSDDDPDLGSTVDFTYTVTNNGPGVADAPSVSDLLPDGLTVSGTVASQGTYDEASDVWTVGSLAANVSATITLTVSAADVGPKTSSATVSASEFDPNTADNTAGATTTFYGTIVATSQGCEVTYDSQTHGITLSVTTEGTTTAFRTTDSGAYDLTANPAFEDAGSYTVWYQLTKEYYRTLEGSAAVKINPKELTISVAVADKRYDGYSTASFKGAPALVGLITGDNVTLVNGVPTFATGNVGKNILINFTAFKITGDDAANYTLVQPNGIRANILENPVIPDTGDTGEAMLWIILCGGSGMVMAAAVTAAVMLRKSRLNDR